MKLLTLLVLSAHVKTPERIFHFPDTETMKSDAIVCMERKDKRGRAGWYCVTLESFVEHYEKLRREKAETTL